jgi:hypothetical protein
LTSGEVRLRPRDGATPEVDRDEEELVPRPEELVELWPPEELDALEKLLLWEDPELEELLELEPPDDECCAKTAEVNNRTTGTARPESLIRHLSPLHLTQPEVKLT